MAGDIDLAPKFVLGLLLFHQILDLFFQAADFDVKKNRIRFTTLFKSPAPQQEMAA